MKMLKNKHGLIEIVLVMFIIAAGMITTALYEYFSDTEKKQLHIQTAMAATGVQLNGTQYLNALAPAEYRITWINQEGTVVYDSQTDTSLLGNHIDREEVKEAMHYGYGASQRYSDTMVERTLYSAQVLPDGTVVRLSMPQHTLLAFVLETSIPIGIILFGIILLAVKLTNTETKRVTKEETDTLRREFSANVSHEMKTPLQIISGFAELIASDMTSVADTRKFAIKIQEEAQRMIRLVQDIITLSKLDENTDVVNKQTVKLNQLCREVMEDLQPVINKKQVNFEIIGKEVEIKGIHHLLYSLFYNICENSIKYNNQGGSVIITTEKTDDAIQVSIRDTGIGMANQELSRIFERFYRVDKSHSKAIGGTGLGLSIAQHIASLHQGKIDVESILGEGSIFVITFSQGKIQTN